MADKANYGLRALVAHSRFCPCRGRECRVDPAEHRGIANSYLDPSHQIDEATYNAMCLDLARDPDFGSPSNSASGEKQRDDANFERYVCAIYWTFRDVERDFLLNIPAGPLRHDDTTTDKWWDAAAHLRHHLEFLLVLRGIKPCVLFMRNKEDHLPTFSTLIIDYLVPLMDQLDLWSYGFRLSFMCGDWVFYDCRSPVVPQIQRIFLTHPWAKQLDITGAYDKNNHYSVPELEVAQALGYPITSDAYPDGHWIYINDGTEQQFLIRREGRHPEQLCCVQGLKFRCPEHGSEADWIRVLKFYHKCEEAAAAVGTKLYMCVEHPEMTAWLERNPGWLIGPVAHFGVSGPRLQEI